MKKKINQMMLEKEKNTLRMLRIRENGFSDLEGKWMRSILTRLFNGYSIKFWTLKL